MRRCGACGGFEHTVCHIEQDEAACGADDDLCRGFLEDCAEAEDDENHQWKFDDAVSYCEKDSCPAVACAHSEGSSGDGSRLHRAGNGYYEDLD